MKNLGIIGLLILGIVFLFMANAFAENLGLTAKVIYVEGKVFIKDAKGNLIALKQGMLVSEGTNLISEDKSYAEIVLNDTNDIKKVNAIRMQSETNIVLTKLNPAEITLNKGKIFFFVRSLKKDRTFEVHTPICVAGVRGTDGAVEFIKNAKVWCFSKDSKVYIRVKTEEIFWLMGNFWAIVEKDKLPTSSQRISSNEIREFSTINNSLYNNIVPSSTQTISQIEKVQEQISLSSETITQQKEEQKSAQETSGGSSQAGGGQVIDGGGRRGIRVR